MFYHVPSYSFSCQKVCDQRGEGGGISLLLPQKYATALQQFEASSSNKTILGRKENQRRATSSTRVEQSKLHRQILRRMQQMQDWLYNERTAAELFFVEHRRVVNNYIKERVSYSLSPFDFASGIRQHRIYIQTHGRKYVLLQGSN